MRSPGLACMARLRKRSRLRRGSGVRHRLDGHGDRVLLPRSVEPALGMTRGGAPPTATCEPTALDAAAVRRERRLRRGRRRAAPTARLARQRHPQPMPGDGALDGGQVFASGWVPGSTPTESLSSRPCAARTAKPSARRIASPATAAMPVTVSRARVLDGPDPLSACPRRAATVRQSERQCHAGGRACQSSPSRESAPQNTASRSSTRRRAKKVTWRPSSPLATLARGRTAPHSSEPARGRP